MKCLCPIRVQLDKGITVFSDFQVRGYTVPCGQCIACRLNYAKFWSIRMMQELKHHDKACFVTLTYDDEHLVSSRLVKRDLQLFFKRLRKRFALRYFACGEYGDSFGRPHYHAIIYGLSPDDKSFIEDSWRQGLVHVGTVTDDSCNYVAKYMTKKLRGNSLKEKLKEDPDYSPEFVLMSRRPGIGSELSPEMEQFLKDTGFVYRKGHRSSIPRYYKDKFDIDVPFHGEKESLHDEKKWLQYYDNHDIYMRKKMSLKK